MSQERFSMKVVAEIKSTANESTDSTETTKEVKAKKEKAPKVEKKKKTKYITKIGPDGVKYMVMNTNFDFSKDNK